MPRCQHSRVTLIVATAWLLLVQPAVAAAASMTTSLSASSVVKDSTFTVTVGVSSSTKVSVVQVGLSYPADKLTPISIANVAESPYNPSAGSDKASGGEVQLVRYTSNAPVYSGGLVQITFKALATGSVNIQLSPPCHTATEHCSALLLANGEALSTVSGATLSIKDSGTTGSSSSSGTTVTLIIVGKDNKPLANVLVTIGNVTGRTDKSGKVTLYGVSPSSKTATVEYHGKTIQVAVNPSQGKAQKINFANAKGKNASAKNVGIGFGIMFAVVLAAVYLWMHTRRARQSASVMPPVVMPPSAIAQHIATQPPTPSLLTKLLHHAGPWHRTYTGLFIACVTLIGVTTLLFSHADVNTADMNSDHIVNNADLQILLSHFNTTSKTGDMDGNGMVDIYDLSEFLSYYGSTVPVPPPTATKPEFFGINTQAQLVWGSTINTPALLSDMSAAGIKYGRVNIEWHWVECDTCAPVNGVHRYNWGSWDSKVRDLANAHLRFQPMIGFSPEWASRNTPWRKAHLDASGNPIAVPDSMPDDQHMADWLAFTKAVVDRYGPNGTFWSANPSIPKLPVQVYEIWNEENAGNGSHWWGPLDHASWAANSAAPAAYAKLFRQTYTTIKADDPSAHVIIGALTGGPSSMSPASDASGNGIWMQRVMAADPTLTMDGIGIHPYSKYLTGAHGVYDLIAQSRNGLSALPAQAKNAPFYITEVGWAAATPDLTWSNMSATPDPPEEPNRAKDISDLVLNLPTSSYNVVQMAPHAAITREKDASDWSTNREQWMGIWNHDGVRKPSAQSYADAIKQANLH